MKSLKEILTATKEFLQRRDIENPRRQAEELIADALDMKRIDLYMQFDRPLNEEEIALCRNSLDRRAKGEPPQYIRGRVDFFDCIIEVNPHVLIPRQETEILVSKVAEKLKGDETVWDICCGSGCIGIALKKRFPNIRLCLSDASPEAIEIARRNASLNGVDAAFLEGDLLAPFKGMKADVVVCNPPYVSPDEYEKLPREVKDYEPKGALVAEEEGLAYYKRLAKELPDYLNSRAMIWLEIGENQGGAVKNLFSWADAHVEQDWSGKDRFVIGALK